MWDPRSPTRAWIWVPCVARQILNYWATREVPYVNSLWELISLCISQGHFWSPCMHVQLLSCVQLCDPMDHSPPDPSVHGILQARILEWVAVNSIPSLIQALAISPDSGRSLQRDRAFSLFHLHGSCCSPTWAMGHFCYTSPLVPQCLQIKHDLFVLLALVALCDLAQVAPDWSSPDPLPTDLDPFRSCCSLDIACAC